MSTKKIKLVQGSTYGSPQFPGDNKTVKLGESIRLDEALADKILEDGFTDKGGTFRYYFEEDDTTDEVDPEGDEGASTAPARRAAAPVKTAARKRS